MTARGDRRATFDVAVEVAAVEWCVTPAELLGRSRERHIAHARQAMYWLCRTAGLSQIAIGRFTGRDYSTIHHGEHAVKERAASGPEVQREKLARLQRDFFATLGNRKPVDNVPPMKQQLGDRTTPGEGRTSP